MQRSQMIPCTFPHPEKEGELIEGYFHLWGVRSQFTSNNETVVENTVGIVEDLSGDIYVVLPENITMKRENK